MKVPVQITYRDVDQSDALDERIRFKVQKLEETFDRMTSCHVIVERPHSSHAQGNRYAVHFGINVPGKEIMVKRDSADHAHEDVYIALKNSYQAARRQLKEYVDRMRAH
ncbi:HPF/RaiA family ribosome-associated protein [Thalassospira xiamenensis]|uniref:RNA polymerase subunit sigma-54 n=1 Tax=Thalassospira xiamenensis TaxID=220697 RepID=A0A367XES8_9PROT|nr:HPF/RaiA family ribosome-associated protein [Thalassospira xiamenensis]KZB56590.1 RNA polymerase subunit sigma-54 [Thalassospira xiamenensis]MCK2166792.1 HPF/RaiA family ribosome-associated protein [Thalassospira xiamenensis]RCK52158.1 RNA polymerase subunit sigma-54 [Thalassospira xiamenensis]